MLVNVGILSAVIGEGRIGWTGRAYVGVDVVLHEGGVKSSNRFQLVIGIQVISQLFQFVGYGI
jgi:hypothetical protein